MRTQPADPFDARRKNILPASNGKNSLFKSGYVSEFGQFIDAFLEEHPEVVQDQRKGWKIYWDKKVDLDELKTLEEDTLPMPPYPHD